jgi:hypothetical protein
MKALSTKESLLVNPKTDVRISTLYSVFSTDLTIEKIGAKKKGHTNMYLRVHSSQTQVQLIMQHKPACET